MPILNKKRFLDRLIPLRVCAAIPGNGGDWNYILWTGQGHSWWVGDPIDKELMSL
jgi:hypothetical protein